MGLVGGEVADGVLLASFALKVDIGPSIAMILFLWQMLAYTELNVWCEVTAHHRNEIDAETALAKLLLKTRVGVVRCSLRKNLEGLFEVTDVSLITGLLEQVPSLILRFVGNVCVVHYFRILAIESNVAWTLLVD